MARKKDKDSAKAMVEYTYRDMGQEFLMRRKMLRAIVLFILTLIALIVFVALYINETKTVQETYRTQYKKCLDSVIYDLDDYINADGDFELRYRMIVGDAAAMSNFAFLRDNFLDEQKSINAIYTVLVKYPEQVKERIEELREIFQLVRESDLEAFQKLDEFVDSINLKGY